MICVSVRFWNDELFSNPFYLGDKSKRQRLHVPCKLLKKFTKHAFVRENPETPWYTEMWITYCP